jgi:hypothetical protein
VFVLVEPLDWTGVDVGVYNVIAVVHAVVEVLNGPDKRLGRNVNCPNPVRVEAGKVEIYNVLR